LIYSAIKLREEECDKSKDVERRGGGERERGSRNRTTLLKPEKKKRTSVLVVKAMNQRT
jgi:hypothetical protein